MTTCHLKMGRDELPNIAYVGVRQTANNTVEYNIGRLIIKQPSSQTFRENREGLILCNIPAFILED
jgi:hypothetical protein